MRTNKKIIALYFVGQVLSVASAGVALFWAAGRTDWWPSWAMMGLWLIWFTAVDGVLLCVNLHLIAERLLPPEGAKSWDKAIVSIIRLTELARYILAGLDHRYGWTGDFPLAAQIAAIVVFIASTFLFAWAMASNPFFTQVVRIQSDHGYTVVTSGPYRYVRHPGYVAGILSELALSTLLASWWAIFAAVLCVVLLLVRTALEDSALRLELPGYADYARQVRYRLAPGIW